MTEERMIRVKKEDIGLLLGTDQMTLPRKKWEELEQIASKDWRPLCTTFTDYDFDTNECNGFIVDKMLEDYCEDCPFRKKKELK